MAYQALVLHLLISAPSDVPAEDLTNIRTTINQWNFNYGRQFGLNILPISWTEHAASEFGERPQAILNNQIVDEADLAVALFCDRLGTPTGEAESGTAEEIKILAEAEKSVGVLVNASLRAPLAGSALEERQRLISYLDDLRKKALVFEYSNATELIQHFNNFLSRSASKFQQRAAQTKDEEPYQFDPSEGVWPRADYREVPTTDSKGRAGTKRKWSIVLHNTSKAPASDVVFSFEDLPEGALFEVIGADGSIGTIAPNEEVKFPLALGWGSPKQVECVVSWTDVNGNERITRGTVRTA